MARKGGHSRRSSTSSASKPRRPPSAAEPYHLVHVRTVHSRHTNSLLSGRRRRLVLPDMQKVTEPGFTGFRHLLLIILFLGNARVLIRDWRQFGWLSFFGFLGFNLQDIKWTVLLLLYIAAFWPLALLIEWAVVPDARKARAEASARLAQAAQVAGSKTSPEPAAPPPLPSYRATALLHAINALTLLAGSSWLTYTKVWHPLLGTILSSYTIISFMKLISFGLTNSDLRSAYINDITVDPLYSAKPYPSNLAVAPMFDYMCVPTLVYQPVYPRAHEIRLRVALGLAGEILLGTIALWLLTTQMAAPVLHHTLLHFRDMDTEGLFDDFLSLLTINIVIWLCMFLLIFQSVLNFAAELTRFADREFYADWWNAGSLGAYWRDWNRPVSNYFRRHVYVPLRKRGVPMFWAQFVVFLYSAIGHELLLGVATKNFNGVAFMCMMGQIPLILATAPLERMRGPGTTVGNCIFWVSVLFGQPLGVIIYYLSWQLKQSSNTWS